MESMRIYIILQVIAFATAFPGCPRGFRTETPTHCVQFVSGVILTRDQSIEWCNKLGANTHLLSIPNKYEAQLYERQALGETWLGLTRSEDDKWSWDDGTPYNYTAWAIGEPNSNYTGFNCAHLTGTMNHYDTWVTNDCKRRWKLACKQKKKSQWRVYNDFEYYAKWSNNWGITWHDARARCMDEGGDLLSITTTEQHRKINYWLSEYDINTKRKLWIGLHAVENQQGKVVWQWSDRSRVNLQFWNESFPISTIEGAKCVYTVGRSASWMNSNCGIRQEGYICKRPKGSTGTPVTDPPPIEPTGYCPKGYIAVEDKCVKVFASEKKTWHEALAVCKKEPGKNPTLVSITNKYVSTMVSARILPGTPDLWVGGYNLPEDGWGWTDGSLADYTNFARYTGHPCLSVGAKGVPLGQWVSDECNQMKAFICQTQKDPNKPIPTAEPRPPDCPTEYTKYNKHCYLLNKDERSWTKAHEYCQKKDGSLVSIENEAENMFVFSKILEVKEDKEKEGSTKDVLLWTGLQDLANTHEYKWIDGSVKDFTSWGRGQPRRAVSGGCVAMRQSRNFNGFGIWEDKNCSAPYVFMCRRPTDHIGHVLH